MYNSLCVQFRALEKTSVGQDHTSSCVFPPPCFGEAVRLGIPTPGDSHRQTKAGVASAASSVFRILFPKLEVKCPSLSNGSQRVLELVCFSC